jgi:hypothetical protein
VILIETRYWHTGLNLVLYELLMQFASVNCVPDMHLWVENDGSYLEEGFKNVKGNI